MADYPHLKLPFQVEGSAKLSGGGSKKKNVRTTANEDNRQQHGSYLKGVAKTLLNGWTQILTEKKKEGFELPNSNTLPLFLQIDTNVFPIDTLLNWGIEVVSEENNGYIIGASFDNLAAFGQNVDMFLNQEGIRKNTAAKIWDMESGLDWRVNNIVKGELAKNWENVQDDTVYIVELGVACYILGKLDYPDRTKFDSESDYQQKLIEFKHQERAIWIERDLLQIEREADIEAYIKFYNGSIVSMWDNGTDAIFFKVAVSGKGLKDIVLTYQYLFIVEQTQQFNVEREIINSAFKGEVNVIPPHHLATKVCVIDSGIQEGHRLISAAVDSAMSRSYVNGDDSVSDYVKYSGHGTKVAGAILYPFSIPTEGDYQLETWIQNARILDNNNSISDDRFGPQLMNTITDDFKETRIFNLSVAVRGAYKGIHMPSLAAAIDKIIYEKDVLFIIAAGNLDTLNDNPENPGITNHFQQNKNYPTYLDLESSKISSPGVSSFAITVGSVANEEFENDDYKSIAEKNYISPFSRSGLGLWGTIKPDVVEYGGNLAKNKMAFDIISNDSLCPELVNSTRYNAPATGSDYGTSFSAPKVTYIASKLQAEHPNETAQMYRALIIQSARLPEHCFNNPTHNDIRYYGYGIPNIERALNNSPGRITFIQNGTLSPKRADIYKLNIPQELRGENNARLLVEVTLTFAAKTRLTRKGAHQYLSSWLEWHSSKYNEDFKSFRRRTIEYLDIENDDGESSIGPDEGADAIKWCLRENPAWANNRINRNNSTAQKSWTVIESHQFANEFSLAIIGHRGWDKDIDNEIPYSICVSFERLNGEIDIYKLLAEAQVEVATEEQEVSI